MSFIVFFVTSSENTPYNYFTRLADALIHGRLYLLEAPSWLSELIPLDGTKWYVPYSPMSGFIAIPFVMLFGAEFPQQILAHLLGAAIVVISYVLAKEYSEKDSKIPLWVALLTSVGTIMWYEASVGSSWYLGQLTAVFFLLLALLLSKKDKSLLVGLCIGAAYLARVHTILSLPLFLFLSAPKKRSILLLIAGVTVGILIGAWYNYARFGVVWDKGYLLIPGVLDEPWFTYGIESPRYIPRNLIAAFWSFPKIIDKWPYIEPSWNSLSIWITTPAFIIALAAPLKRRLVQFLWISVALIFLFVLAHGSNGFAQFGYRFAIDFYPFLILLTIIGLNRTGIKKIYWFLLIVGILVNLWGVVFINIFDWVGF